MRRVAVLLPLLMMAEPAPARMPIDRGPLSIPVPPPPVGERPGRWLSEDDKRAIERARRRREERKAKRLASASFEHIRPGGFRENQQESSMISKEQLDKWFTYHPPTPETAPKYAAIREAEHRAGEVSVAILNGGSFATYAEANARCRAFVEVIDANAPDGADKAAAIRCVCLARNALNEALTAPRDGGEVPYNVVMLCREAEGELRKARWQANTAIACG